MWTTECLPGTPWVNKHIIQSTRGNISLPGHGSIIRLKRFIRLVAIEYYIDQQKLGFFKKLCGIPTDCLTKQLFLCRLKLYAVRDYNHQLRFIPDIFRSLTKCKLVNNSSDYLKNSTFSSK